MRLLSRQFFVAVVFGMLVADSFTADAAPATSSVSAAKQLADDGIHAAQRGECKLADSKLQAASKFFKLDPTLDNQLFALVLAMQRCEVYADARANVEARRSADATQSGVASGVSQSKQSAIGRARCEPQPQTGAYIPLKNRIETALAAVTQVSRAGGSSRQLGLNLLLLGELEASGTLLNAARAHLTQSVNLLSQQTDSAENLRCARTTLEETLLNLEATADAERLALQTDDGDRWRAAIAVMKGDHDVGSNAFLKLLRDAIGDPSASQIEMKFLNDQRDKIPIERLRRSWDLLLTWANASFGQEELIERKSPTSYDTYFRVFPAAALAERVLMSLPQNSLTIGDAWNAEDRIRTGCAAFLRGESHRRAGMLTSVDVDQRYAEFESSDVTGGEGCAYRSRLTAAALAADQGRDEAALEQAREAFDAIERDLGKASLAWAEAASLVSDLQYKQHDYASARATALAAAEEASSSLSPQHSLTVRLHVQAAEASFELQKVDEAVQTILAGLGISHLNPATRDQILNAVRALPKESTWPERYSSLADVLGLQHAPQESTTAQRISRNRAEHLLSEIATLARTNGQPNVPIGALADALVAEDNALIRAGAGGRARPSKPDGLFGDLIDRVHGYATSGGRNAPDAGFRILQVTQATNPFLSPTQALPSDYRPNFKVGDDTAALETLMKDMHAGWVKGAIGTLSKETLMSSALAIADAATRGDAYSTTITPIAASQRGLWGVRLGDPDLARQAVAIDLYRRRLGALSVREIISAKNEGDRAKVRSSVQKNYVLFVQGVWAVADRISGAYLSGDNAFSAIVAQQGGGPYIVNQRVLQDSLLHNEAIVVWLPLETVTELFVVKWDNVDWVELPVGRSALGIQIHTLLQEIDDVGHDVNAGRRVPQSAFPAQDANGLYHTLFDAITPDLRDIQHIFTVQLGTAADLPFRILVAELSASKSEAPVWLGDKFYITRMPNLINPAAFGVPSSKAPRQDGAFLAIGNPILDGDSKTNRTSATAGPPVSATFRLPPLPDSGPEMRAIAHVMGESRFDRAIFEGQRATKDNALKQLDNRKLDVLLFSTHGLTGNEEMLAVGEPALVLTAPVQASDSDDGLLRGSDIAFLKFDVGLVILSGCSTGEAVGVGGDALAGLATAFLTAGGQNVLASNWVVRNNNSVSQKIVEEYHLNHTGTAESLEKSIKQLRGAGTDRDSFAHPIFWAAFELMGFPSGREGNSKR